MRYEAPPDASGRRRRPWAGPYPTKTAAEQDLVRLQGEARTGRPPTERRLKVGVFLRRWLDGKKSLAPSTRKGYEEHITLYLDPGIGHLYLAELREHHLDELYAALGRINRPEEPEGERDELMRRLLAARTKAAWDPSRMHNRRPLSPARIRRVHATMSSALSAARRQGLITHDPSKQIELPSERKRRPLVWTTERVERWRRQVRIEEGKDEADRRPVPLPSPVMVWTPEQAGQMLDWLEEREDRLYALWHLIMTRGLRRGEAGRLEWVDTDLDGARTLSVLEDEDGEAAAGIKSDSSRRVVMLGAENIELLKAWRQQQRGERLAAGERWADSGRVFTDELGRALDLNYLTYRWKRLVRAAGLPPVRLHDLRHCAATLMLAGGVDMKVVSATLGHRQYWFTADTYASVVPELAESAAEAAVAVIPRARKA